MKEIEKDALQEVTDTETKDAKHYVFSQVEQQVLLKNKEQIFYSDLSSIKSPYTIIMPPPNVTGYLHMGHALVTTLQDVMARYKRMQGFDVLWQPGVDHAGIATQVIVEKQLMEKGIKKQDLGREKFLEKVYEWKDNSAGKIIEQIKRMGSSCDFSYLAFTMDAHSIKGVNKAFVKLYEAGLIYQDDRLVNWDSNLKTAISDLEVEVKEVKGSFYYLRYKIVGSDNFLIVATTRPETIFGDVAVAVNPTDDRYNKLIGKEVLIPIVNRKVKIIGDLHADPTKGSGVVKITPAHDFNDFEVGKKHNLEVINILNKDGTLNAEVLEGYQGLSIKDARKKILEHLKELDLIEKIEDTILAVPYGDRTGVVVEPLLTKQWFLNAEALAKDAISAVKSKKMEFIPESWENLYFDWMENIRPWCISRQLWWGHRIPVYYGEDGKIFVCETKEIAEKEALAYYGKPVELKQDEDVLDTWFSSSLWPFLTLGWPESQEKLAKYYPTNLLITAFDIIFFWVARMVMMSMFFMKEVPFQKVYIHGLIRDEKGHKMSKSKGNVIDPLVLMDKYGTDALRFSLVAYSGQGRDIKISEKVLEGYRNFITKIWNSFKFCEQNGIVYNQNFNPNAVSLEINHWILNKLQNLQQTINSMFDQHKFNEVASAIYQFIWKDYCDLYIEFSKSILYSDSAEEKLKVEIRETMGLIFDNTLKFIHPIMPFVSDYLYEQLHKNGKLIALESYPNNSFILDDNAILNVENMVEFVSKIRRIRLDFNISPAVFLQVSFEGEELPLFIANNLDVVKKIARLSEIKIVNSVGNKYIKDTIGTNIFGVLADSVVDIEVERVRILNAKAKIQAELDKVTNMLNNQAFMAKANKLVIEEFEQQRVNLKDSLVKLDEILLKIKNM